MKSTEHMSRNQRDKLRKSLEEKEHAEEIIVWIERSSEDKLDCLDCKENDPYR